MSRTPLALRALPLLVAAGCAYTPGQVIRFFQRCPAAGPTREASFALHLVPVDVDAYDTELLAAAGPAPHRVVATVETAGRSLAMHHFGPLGSVGGRRVLVVAAVHGNEIAGSLAAPRILEDVRSRPGAYTGIELHLIAPANPVGLFHLSRYDQRGCDVNRDFDRFQTPEARAIRDVLDEVRPALVLSLHEGPHDGFFAFATIDVPPDVGAAVVDDVAAAGIPLAERSFLPLVPLARPGLLAEGRLATAVKRIVGLGTLASYAHAHGVADVTTETPWSSPDLEARVRAHVIAVRAVARALAGSRPAPSE